MADQKADPFLGNPLVEQFLIVAEKWIACDSNGADAAERVSELRHIASLLFANSRED